MGFQSLRRELAVGCGKWDFGRCVSIRTRKGPRRSGSSAFTSHDSACRLAAPDMRPPRSQKFNKLAAALIAVSDVSGGFQVLEFAASQARKALRDRTGVMSR